MKKNEWPAVVIALAFIGLLALIFWTTMEEMSTADEFLKIWAAVGPVVGVVTGLVPTYFFRNAAADASEHAQRMSEKAGKMQGMMLAKGMNPDAVEMQAKANLTDGEASSSLG